MVQSMTLGLVQSAIVRPRVTNCTMYTNNILRRNKFIMTA